MTINPAASERELLVQLLLAVDANQTLLLERLNQMTQIATDTNAAVLALDSKVDALIAAIQPAIAALTQQLAAAQAQVAALQADAAADTTTLQATIAEAQAQTAEVQAALDALTPTPPPTEP